VSREATILRPHGELSGKKLCRGDYDPFCSTGWTWLSVGGRPSSLEAASSQTWASCCKDTRASFAFASRAHLKHSSAIARYSAAVFIGRCAPFPAAFAAGFASLSVLAPTQQRNYYGQAPARHDLFAEQLGCGPSARLILEIDTRKLLPGAPSRRRPHGRA
jgi:hypothetical protein